MTQCLKREFGFTNEINYAYNMRIINVLIIAHPLCIRQNVKHTLSQHPHFWFKDLMLDSPQNLIQNIEQFKADVLVIHFDSLTSDDIAFIETIMKTRPIATIVLVDDLKQHQNKLQAIENIGVYKIFELPENATRLNQQSIVIHDLAKTITNAAYIRITNGQDKFYKSTGKTDYQPDQPKTFTPRVAQCHDAIIAIGSSTGGIIIVETILKHLPTSIPPIVITQHIPPVFSQSLAQRLDEKLSLNVYEARQNQKLETGSVYIAPGDWHLEVVCHNNHYVCQLSQTERVNSHRPSADIMFDSIIRLKPKDSTAIILTGMGSDGVQALLRMKQNGFYTIAQDKRSALIWGMPGEAVKAGASCEELAPEEIANYLAYHYCSEK